MIDRKTAAGILTHPLDPSFTQKYMRQFTAQYLEELADECRELIQDLYDQERQRIVEARKPGTNAPRLLSEALEFLKRRRAIIGRLSAIVRELNQRKLAARHSRGGLRVTR